MNEPGQQILVQPMNNGMTLLGEVMPWLESAAFSFSIPAGCQHDPPDRRGLASFVCEMAQRGAGLLDSRQLLERLEMLGVDSSSSVSLYGTHFSGAMPAERLFDALAVYRDILRQPWLPDDQIDDVRNVCMQEIRSIDDDLAQRVMLQLRLRQYGEPAGWGSQGTMDGVAAIDRSAIRWFARTHYQPDGAVLSVAGNIDWPRFVETTHKLFGDWSGKGPQPPADSGQVCSNLHIPFESHQSHIAVACPTLTYRDPDYFLARAAAGVLSDGMSSRLFAELRERHGLCYSVFASIHSILNKACLLSYVGTGPDRAQQALDALVGQLVVLRQGITAEELDRFRIQLRSSLIMQQESSRSRASANAGDWIYLGRVRTMDELTNVVNSLNIADVNRFLAERPLSDFNLVTLGPDSLDLNHAISHASSG
jgi:predicted Zn-dependent peptidase